MLHRVKELHTELSKVETDISAWCQRMAWPGKAPTPPFAAWEKRSAIWEELKSLGIERPKGFHTKSIESLKLDNAA